MSDSTIGEPLGPGGVAARMAEIRAEMQMKTGAPATPTGAPGSFMSMVQANLGGPSALSGQISGGGSYSPRPLSPFAGGLGVEENVSPQLRALTQQAAATNGVDPDVLDALVHQESGYSVSARSKVGAMGLTQLMPETAASLGVTNPFDPAQNLNAGAKYLKQQIDRFGDLGQALAAYNAGPNAVVRHGGIPPYKETQNYVRSILSRVQQVKELPHG
ncbi:MAG TPA: lytic transglycosylase domain-containing protein [Fimbriimonadaceae bacterium]|nr:lytic transglycosylase domain-containing protein [Fimbriimonadaceae bacterium]